VELATGTSVWTIRTDLCSIALSQKPFFGCHAPVSRSGSFSQNAVVVLRRRGSGFFAQGARSGYLDWKFGHTPGRGKRREAKLDQESFFLCGGRLSRPLASGIPAARGRSQGDPRQHNTCRHVDRPGCGLYNDHPNLEGGRFSSLPRKGQLVPRWWGAIEKSCNKTDASDPRPPATARWALGHALVGFRLLPLQPTRGRNNMTRDRGPRVCMEVPRGRRIGDRKLSESPFE